MLINDPRYEIHESKLPDCVRTKTPDFHKSNWGNQGYRRNSHSDEKHSPSSKKKTLDEIIPTKLAHFKSVMELKRCSTPNSGEKLPALNKSRNGMKSLSSF